MFCAKYYEKNALFDKICVTLQPVTNKRSVVHT